MSVHSLKQRLALSLTAVLTGVFLVDASFSYGDALDAANQAYDRSLAAALRGIAERSHATAQGLVVDLPSASLELVEPGSDDQVFYAVRAQDGALIAGDSGLPPPSGAGDDMVFYDGLYKGRPLRLAAMRKRLGSGASAASVELLYGETTQSRHDMVQRIFLREATFKALLIVLALTVSLLVTRRSVKPIEALGQSIRDRRADDLSPVEVGGLPQELRPLVEALNQHTGRISALVDARKRFITDAAHQLRTPLAVLSTQADYALRQSDVAEMRVTITALRRSLAGAIRMSNQMLSLARAEAMGGPLLRREIVDLGKLAAEVVLELLPLAMRKQQDLGVDLECQKGWCACVPGDPLLLREMLSNLLDNALRYTDPGAVITVSVGEGRRPGWLRLDVLDNGPGISEADREAVFDRFFRPSGQAVEGSGLGLAIVREIVSLHGGHIRLDAAPGGRGLLVEVELPGRDPGARGTA